MFGESKQARLATTALIYLTSGALIAVWSVIYYIYLWRHEGTDVAYLWCHGFFFSGLILVGIGMAIGRIGRAARPAEADHLPEVVPTPVQPQAPMNAPLVANGQAQPIPAPMPPIIAHAAPIQTTGV